MLSPSVVNAEATCREALLPVVVCDNDELIGQVHRPVKEPVRIHAEPSPVFTAKRICRSHNPVQHGELIAFFCVLRLDHIQEEAIFGAPGRSVDERKRHARMRGGDAICHPGSTIAILISTLIARWCLWLSEAELSIWSLRVANVVVVQQLGAGGGDVSPCRNVLCIAQVNEMWRTSVRLRDCNESKSTSERNVSDHIPTISSRCDANGSI